MPKKKFTRVPGTPTATASAKKPVTADPGKGNPETLAGDALKSPARAVTPKPPSSPRTFLPKASTPLAAPVRKRVIAEEVSQPKQVPTPEASKSPARAGVAKPSTALGAVLKPPTETAAAAPKTFTRPPSPKPAEKSVAVEQPARSMPPETVNAAFVLHAPQARQVSVCGDFNEWEPTATPMKRQAGGRWGTTVALQPGRYQYKFVADGQWMHDSNAQENVPNEHGSLNSVIEIRV